MKTLHEIESDGGFHPYRTVQPFRNAPPIDFALRPEREQFTAALKFIPRQFPTHAPLIIGGKRIETAETIESRNPSAFAQLVGESASAGIAETERAIGAARKAFPRWARTPAEERASILIRAADLLHQRKREFMALSVYEAAKTWHEADAEVNEAIDFLNYYAREAIRLGRPRTLQPHLLGEQNQLSYHPIGVAAVIGPWNFPLAIPTGMGGAAIAAGNTVVLKPAEQTPLIAYRFVELLEEAGLPHGVMNYLPGRGETCGAHLVTHPGVQLVVFTGSREVGLRIIEEGARHRGQPFIRRTITEMGGKNAIIIDSSADIDAAVPDVLYSAFGFSGQKCSACSRLIVLQDIYREFMKRLCDGAAALKIGPAEHPATQVNALIDGEARGKVQSYIDLGASTARRLFQNHQAPDAGYYVAPAIFEVDAPSHRLMQEEIFGPVLTAIKARTFREAISIANSTQYALTGGVHSRTLANLDVARTEFLAGNLYLNRTITGAIVGRQPFGGFALSGIGSKAGGPDYLKQFLLARAVSENLMRHGSAMLTPREEQPEEA